jgi:hypothetical protein
MPKPKKPERVKCEECKKTYSKRSVLKAPDGRWLCGHCRKFKVITNPFYKEPPTRKNETISDYNISDAEKKFLHKQLMKRGMPSEKAWAKIDKDSRILKKMKQQKQYSRQRFAIEKQIQINQHKKFLEGLGQK